MDLGLAGVLVRARAADGSPRRQRELQAAVVRPVSSPIAARLAVGERPTWRSCWGRRSHRRCRRPRDPRSVVVGASVVVVVAPRWWAAAGPWWSWAATSWWSAGPRGPRPGVVGHGGVALERDQRVSDSAAASTFPSSSFGTTTLANRTGPTSSATPAAPPMTARRSALHASGRRRYWEDVLSEGTSGGGLLLSARRRGEKSSARARGAPSVPSYAVGDRSLSRSTSFRNVQCPARTPSGRLRHPATRHRRSAARVGVASGGSRRPAPRSPRSDDVSEPMR